jgi:hypothetical protein
MVTRNLTVCGFCEPDTVLEVTVDGKTYRSHTSTDQLFDFCTNVTFHGAKQIHVRSITGSAVLESCLATYPARFNNGFFSKWYTGSLTFRQPIENIFCIVDNGIVIPQKTLKINFGQSVTYLHPMYNGPNEFLVSCPKNTPLHSNINVVWNDKINLVPNWGYEYLDLNWDQLKTIVEMAEWPNATDCKSVKP